MSPGVPAMFVQAKAGHAQGSMTERYLHPSKTSYPDAAELAEARAAEPSGLSRKAVATLSRIGLGKPMQKREGAVCERISKGRMQLLDALRRSDIRGDAS